MQSSLKLLSMLLVLAALPGAGRADAPAKAMPPEPLPPRVVKAWEAAGAETFWMRPSHKNLHMEMHGFAEPGDIPAFWFYRWSPGQLEKLPALDVPFGLSIGNTRVTNAGLKELAKLKNLQMLKLFSTEVSDAGLKELVGLHKLQMLDLSYTKVTNAGLKELAPLKNLRSLQGDLV